MTKRSSGEARDDVVRAWPIAVTGMHRSGTSMITRGLHDSGLHLIGGAADALLEAADDNPEGFWENKAIVACNDDLLEAAGGAWDNPPAFPPPAVDDPRVAEVVERATEALVGLRQNARWGFKDPRTCLTAGFWLDLQPDLRFVICVRNPLEVALSLKRRNQNSYSLGLSLWERYYTTVLDLVPEDRRIVTHYDTYFLDPAGELARVCDFAGLEPAPPRVLTELRHHDVGVSLEEANVGPTISRLYRDLCAEAGMTARPAAAVDEGHVRRLVLDGTVAARHAEQRQAAIERLEERLAEAQRELVEVRRESASRHTEIQRRESELNVMRADAAVSREQHLHLVDVVHSLGEMVEEVKGNTSQLVTDRERLHRRLDRLESLENAIHVKVRAVEDTVASSFVLRLVGAVRRRSVPAAKRTVKGTARRMPQPVRHQVRRVQRAVADGQAANRLKERGNRMVGVLPSPAQTAARRSVTAVRDSPVAPRLSRVSRGLRRRVPPSVKRRLRRVASSGVAPRPAPPRPPKAAPAPRPRAQKDGRETAVPKGPPAFRWLRGYHRLVTDLVDDATVWAVVTPGTRADVEEVEGRRGWPTRPAIATPAADCLS
ncbi:MAG: sulfotransferase [Acidimicrobiales bacterium]